MTTSRRIADHKNERFAKNVLKRGAVPESVQRKDEKLPVSVYVIGFFIFVIIGSSIFQIIRNAQSRTVE